MLPYVAESGDTWFRISRKFAIHVNALLCANPHLQPDMYVAPGQVLHIPARPVNLVVAQAGDTGPELARRFNVDFKDMQSANPGLNEKKLREGQMLVLPPGPGMCAVSTDGPYGYLEMMEDLERLLRKYPLIQVEMIGESVMGRGIPALRIGEGPRQIQVNGAFHANEWITSMALMKFAEEYAAACQVGGTLRRRDAAALYRQTTLWLVPMVNPDGVELVHAGIHPQHPYYRELLNWNDGSFDFRQWKANIRGVDLNDQFPAYWEEEKARRSSEGPGPRDYAGTAPLTEPEALAMVHFTERHDFGLVIAFHTQGREIYWNYRGMEPPEAEQLAGKFATASGYRPVKLTDSDAGYKDWFIQRFRRPGFTVECGFGVNPLPLEQFHQIYGEAANLLLTGLEELSSASSQS